jgi:ferredoxin-NADP reductase
VPVRCVSVRDEARGIKTFEFEIPPGRAPKEGLLAGQHALFELDLADMQGAAGPLQRTWTVSSHPAWSSKTFTISVGGAGERAAALEQVA